MQRTMWVYTLAASMILALGVPAAHGSVGHTRHAREAGRQGRVSACGVERWWIKTGSLHNSPT